MIDTFQKNHQALQQRLFLRCQADPLSTERDTIPSGFMVYLNCKSAKLDTKLSSFMSYLNCICTKLYTKSSGSMVNLDYIKSSWRYGNK